MSDLGLLENLDFRRELGERAKIIRSYTHAVIMMDNGKLACFGSGVAFRLGERLFLITAGHNLANRPFEVHFFCGEKPSVKGRVLNYHFHPDSLLENAKSDIGFIELENRTDISACEFEQLHIGPRIAPQPPHETILLIAGFPEVGHQQYAPLRHELGISVIPGRLEAVEERILRLQYDKAGLSIGPNGEYCEEIEFPRTPKGFSGGGVWTLMTTQENELFNPIKHIRMCGTDYAWFEQSRILLAVRPRISVPLFFESYPDLKADYGHLVESRLAE